MKIEKLEVGQVVYMTMRQKMGNTSLKTTSVFRVFVKEINREGNGSGAYVMASWNGNPARKFFQKEVSKWKAEKPVLIHSRGIGGSRLATKEELKAIAAGTFTGNYS